MRLLLAALLLASCAVAQKPTVVAAPVYATDFAHALCERDATYVAGHVAGRLEITEEDLRSYFAALPTCSTARFLASDPAPTVTRFVFILTDGGAEVPYELTFDENLNCIDVR